MYGYIYIVINLVNGKIYIGQRKGGFDPSYFGSGKLIDRAIKLYGIRNFELHIIQFCKSQVILNKKEIYWIKYYKSRGKKNGYNITKGGNGGDTLTNNPNKLSIIEKLSKVKFSKERRKRCSIRMKKLFSNDKWKKKFLAKMKKARNTKEVRNKIANKSKENWKKKSFRDKQMKTRRSKKYIIKQSKAIRNQKKYKCKYCTAIMAKSNLTKWHNDNCKYKPGYDESKRFKPRLGAHLSKKSRRLIGINSGNSRLGKKRGKYKK